jgi:hypothetical protein
LPFGSQIMGDLLARMAELVFSLKVPFGACNLIGTFQ